MKTQIAESPERVLEELREMTRIDFHAHPGVTARHRERLAGLLDRLNMKWLCICYGGTTSEALGRRIETARELHERFPDRFAWVSSFDLEDWGRPGWQRSTIDRLEEDFSRGAVGVKVWKEIGMMLRDEDGGLVMVDHPSFDPVFDFIERSGKSLTAHIGEPLSCWLPMSEITVHGDYEYYSAHPEEHCHGRKEIPHHREYVDAMDRVQLKHPGLRVIRCHLASLESELDVLAGRMERFPNFAVDLAARVGHLQCQPAEIVRSFLIEHQDRVLYGTDAELDAGDPDGLSAELEEAEKTYESDLLYFAGEGTISTVDREEPVECLHLPPAVLRKIFFDNHRRWYPGL